MNNQRKAGELLSTDQHRSPYHYAPISFGMATYTTPYLTGRQRAHTGLQTFTFAVTHLHWSFSVDQDVFSPKYGRIPFDKEAVLMCVQFVC